MKVFTTLMRGPLRLVFTAGLAGLLSVAPAEAQFPGGGGGGFPSGPSIPSPGPSRPTPGPSRPTPGYPSHRPNRPQPTYPHTNPGRPRTPGHSGSNRFGSGRNNPGVPQAPSPYQPYQPKIGRHSDPGSVRFNRVYTTPTVPTSQPWRQAQRMMQQGKFTGGRELIDAQLRSDRSLGNMMSAVQLLEQSNVPNSMLQPYRNQALELAQQQMKQGIGQPLPYVTVAKFSLEDNNDARFREATAELYRRFPEDKHAQYFHGVKSIKDGDWEEAEAALRKAKELGMPEESINSLLLMAINKQRWLWQFAQIAGVVVAVWVLGLIVIFCLGKYLSGRVLAMLRRRGMEAAGRQKSLRTVYRWVVNAAGIYYYISLPIVTLLAIAIPLSIAYPLLYLPDVSLILIGVVGVLGLGGVITAISGLRACFIRWHNMPLPGRTVAKTESPGLWRVAEEVAEKVGTRPVDEIRLLVGADIAVTEQGSFLQRMRDKGKRVLFLGTGAIDGFQQSDFRSVLAHEYGHFLNRDTAGGDIALRVQAAMGSFADAILARGKIRWWDISVQFLRVYHYLFRRLTFGASRLQEVLADRVAVLAYGPSAVRSGLEHAIRQSLRFEQTTGSSLRRMLRGQPAAASHFAPTAEYNIDQWQEIEEAFREIFNRRSTQDDTHPSPAERCRLAQQLGANDPPASPGTVWDLLGDRDSVQTWAQREIDNALAEEAQFLRTITRAELQFLSQVVRGGQHPEALLERARVYNDLGEFSKALADLGRVPSNSPLAVHAELGKSMVYRAMEDYAAEGDILRNLLAGDTRGELPRFELLYRLGRNALEQNDVAAAVDNFSAALNEASESVPALVGRGQAHLLAGSRELALDDFTAALSHSPNCPEAISGKAEAERPAAPAETQPMPRAQV